jgi:hypothetical protein
LTVVLEHGRYLQGAPDEVALTKTLGEHVHMLHAVEDRQNHCLCPDGGSKIDNSFLELKPLQGEEYEIIWLADLICRN